ncbi:hypothetical protein ACFU2J_00500 [Streptomyces sp. NPDC057387]|uniref:hypothetical protein n=1 Tax=Streptomyces sp. NPDC057387 TaxID=3346115 RepID=UPI00363B1D9B
MQNVVTHFPGHGTLFEEMYLEAKNRGKIESRGESILRVRERLTTCADLDTLAMWFDRSLTVSKAEDLFTGETEATTAS